MSEAAVFLRLLNFPYGSFTADRLRKLLITKDLPCVPPCGYTAEIRKVSTGGGKR